MGMTPQESIRLKRLEEFVERLKLNSYIAKASASDREDSRVLGNVARLRDHGEQVLAKAATTFDSADALMKLGEKAIQDPTTMGEFSSHISSGNVAEARRMLDRATDKASFAKSVDAAEDLLNAPLDNFANKRGLSELAARFGDVERTLASITQRLDALERRPQAAPLQPGQQTIVKAQGRTPMTKGQRAEDLLRRIDRYIDHPGLTGQLSSLVQQGKLDEVEAVVQRAQAAHETAQIRNERRSWGN